jgi:hypothetical protein
VAEKEITLQPEAGAQRQRSDNKKRFVHPERSRSACDDAVEGKDPEDANRDEADSGSFVESFA